MTNKQRAVANAMGAYRSKEFKKLCDNLVPCVYAAIGEALWDRGWRFERINKLFADSQKIWAEHAGDGKTMIQRFEEKSGIELQSDTQW